MTPEQAIWHDLDSPLAPAVDVTTLRELLAALGTAVVKLVEAPAGGDVSVSSVALVDRADLSIELDVRSKMPDLFIHVGVPEEEAIRWFDQLSGRVPENRPRAVMSKLDMDSTALVAAASRSGVALVAVHPQARWDRVFSLVQSMLDRARQRQANEGPAGPVETDTDLFELAQVVAQNAGGLVTIEDSQSHVLAYSVTDQTADELRTLSILGREGPREYLRVLREWGVFDRLRESDDVVDVPARPELGIKRRMAASIRQPTDDATIAPRVLGSIWVQYGDKPLAADAADVVKGAAAAAARILSRALDAPSTHALLIQRLFGVRSGSVDVPSVVSMLNLPTTGPSAVVGFAAMPGKTATSAREFERVANTLRLHASAFRRDSLTVSVKDRMYVLLPRYTSVKAVSSWARQIVGQFESQRAIMLRAALAVPVVDLGHVADARAEVDRVLDGTAATFPEGRVTTFAESRTAVLLSEILTTIGQHPGLHDPRLDELVRYDDKHSSDLCASVTCFLANYGDVRQAASALQIHPNTLRYRLRRVEKVLGIDLQVPSDRLLLELQLALRQRGVQ